MLRPAANRQQQQQPLSKRSNGLDRFSEFGLNDGELNNNNNYHPAAFQGYQDSERVGFRAKNIPIRFLATSLRLLSFLVSLWACQIILFKKNHILQLFWKQIWKKSNYSTNLVYGMEGFGLF